MYYWQDERFHVHEKKKTNDYFLLLLSLSYYSSDCITNMEDESMLPIQVVTIATYFKNVTVVNGGVTSFKWTPCHSDDPGAHEASWMDFSNKDAIKEPSLEEARDYMRRHPDSIERCPECKELAVRRCMCGGGEFVCPYWHVWTWCAVHKKTRSLHRGERHESHWPLDKQCNCPSSDPVRAIGRFMSVLALLDDSRRSKLIQQAETLLTEMPEHDPESQLKTSLLHKE